MAPKKVAPKKKAAPVAKTFSAGALASAVGARTPKTRKGRKIVKMREPQPLEEAKTALLLRGNKGGLEVQQMLSDLHRLRNPLSTLFSRSHDIHPFEDFAKVESLCKKSDHGLFAFGSSSKKRPHRLILGRLFDGRLLDMQEFKVENFKAMNAFPSLKREAVVGGKPLLLFQGAAFETDDRLKKVKSLCLEFFGGAAPDKVLLEGLEHVMVFSAVEGTAVGGESDPTVVVKRYNIQKKKSGSKLPRVELAECGPAFDLKLDRVKDSDREVWKKATRTAKQLKPKKEKNITTKAMGKTTGRIHLGKQDFHAIHTVHHGKAKEKKLQGDLAQQVKKKLKRKAA